MRVYVWLGGTALVVALVIGFWPESLPPEAPLPVSGAPAQSPAELPSRLQTTNPAPTPNQNQVSALAPATPSPADSELWPGRQWSQQPSKDGFPLYSTQADPVQVRQLDKGMGFVLPLPNGAEPVKARITEKRSGFGGMPVLTGTIGANSESAESVTVVRGKLDTHMTIITRQATWTAVIDNETGKTVVVDERDRMKNQMLDVNDGVEVDHPPLPEPPTS